MKMDDRDRQEIDRGSLYEEMRAYCGSDAYPLHMPGHKRRLGSFGDPFKLDLTEIDGFDNLHHAEGILLRAQERAANLYGSRRSFFLINGSTCGILAAISACCASYYAEAGMGEEPVLIMARNSHKAAYHAVELNRLKVHYLWPAAWIDPEQGSAMINGPIRPEDLEIALQQHSNVCGVYITSPTYDGVVSDIEALGKIAHKYGTALIVDEAHGAHFGFHADFPDNSVALGADLVIHSLHKTMPSLTQTALLHCNGDLISPELMEKYLGIYQSSSPSYLLMASIDQCIRIIEKDGERLFQEFADRLRSFRKRMQGLKQLRILSSDDPSKILIACDKRAMTGLELADRLRKEYRLELEMTAPGYGLALMSIGDDEEGFDRLGQALLELDAELAEEEKASEERKENEDSRIRKNEGSRIGKNEAVNRMTASLGCKEESLEAATTIWQASVCRKESVKLEQSAGWISSEYIYLYPPGIPLITPGERMEEKLLEQILSYRDRGYSLQGMKDHQMELIDVVYGSKIR